MELRKVIKFGRATYSITLPKQWITEQNIKKGDVVRVEHQPTGNLEIYPNEEAKEPEVSSIDILADNKTTDDINREVVAAYIKNYTIINIKGDLKGKIKELRPRLQQLVGLEIMEVSANKIIAKSFLDITQTRVDHTLKRIYFIIKSMSDEFKGLLKRGGTKEEIFEMDEEVNRNTFFTMKFLFKALEKPELASKMGMKSYEIFFTWELVSLLENVADKIKMLADSVANQKVLLKSGSKEEFLKLYEDVMAGLNFTMQEYFKKNKESVHMIFGDAKERDRKCNQFLKEHKQGWTPLLIDHLKDINMYTEKIADIIVDFD